jgi:ABC-type transport system substrate-binding protein
MRIHISSARTAAALAGTALLCVTATACSSGGSAASSASTSSTSASPSASPSATTSSQAISEITSNWETFFNPSSSVATRVGLLQNGSDFSSAISSLISNPLASKIDAKVDGVTLNPDGTTAAVKWEVDSTSGGTALLPNQTGEAVLQDGQWKLGYASLCSLLGLIEKNLPAACNS